MRGQSWLASVIFALIGFGGGYFAGARGPAGVSGGTPAPSSLGMPAACYFSPDGGCTDAIVAELSDARNSIDLEGYSFTSHAIGDALIAAQKRGVHVTVVLDAAQTSEYRKEAQYLVHHGVPVYLDAKHAIAHNKVVLIDARTLITGSFNFTKAAEDQNAENVLVLHDQPKLQSAYENNFQIHLSHSLPYDGT